MTAGQDFIRVLGQKVLLYLTAFLFPLMKSLLDVGVGGVGGGIIRFKLSKISKLDTWPPSTFRCSIYAQIQSK